MDGKPLTDPQQILEIKPQDIIIPAGENNVEMQGDKVMINVSRFIDELLTSFYGLEAFYNIKKKEDLVGHLVLALAPHISAGMVGRIIGFSQTQGFFAHPLFHAALRRDCDGDEGSISLLLDGLLNFSRQYLPNRRGARTMDAPLVLTSKLIPSEVDDQAHGLDIVERYPLEFYEAALEYKPPWEVGIEQINNRLGTPLQYEQMKYTLPVDDMNDGAMYSAYKSLPSMAEKLEGQMEIAKKIRAVEESFVATLTISKHFLKDTKGNLRKFSLQRFRCVACNEKYRRPPLIGRCTVCNGKVIFTISQGSIVKYLEPSIHIAEKYGAEPYITQTLMLLKKRVESIFGKEKEKQEALGKWFG
jgi:DNA polymerase II large subunit